MRCFYSINIEVIKTPFEYQKVVITITRAGANIFIDGLPSRYSTLHYNRTLHETPGAEDLQIDPLGRLFLKFEKGQSPETVNLADKKGMTVWGRNFKDKSKIVVTIDPWIAFSYLYKSESGIDPWEKAITVRAKK